MYAVAVVICILIRGGDGDWIVVAGVVKVEVVVGVVSRSFCRYSGMVVTVI